MGILRNLFRNNKANSPDVLGRYPEYMQVRALPERRYLKTSRVLAVFILFNLAVTLGLAGYYAYSVERVDVSIMSRKAVNLFYIDTEKKLLKPAEHPVKSIYATQLMAEAMLRQYINERHTILWDNDKMGRLWGRGSFVQAMSAPKTVYDPFVKIAEQDAGLSRSKGFVRDVHLYELEYVYEDLWQAIFDTFDMPIPDSFNPLCDCTDNSQECISCKKEHAYDRKRYKVFIRTSFNNIKSIGNPLGFLIYSYQVVPMVVRDNNFWDTPRALKPEL